MRLGVAQYLSETRIKLEEFGSHVELNLRDAERI